MKKVIVTTSWDDGHKLDIKLAYLLKKYGIKGTFYVSPKNHEFSASELLTISEIKEISKDFEIGAHTMTHPHLTDIASNRAHHEIKNSKGYLEKIINRDVVSFCYPYGNYNRKILGFVKKNGFQFARTVKKYGANKPSNNYETHTSLETHRISFMELPKELLMLLRIANYNVVEMFRMLDWEYLAIKMFDRSKEKGGIFHLWGHSWVVEKQNEFDKLERVLRYISKSKHVMFITNAEMVNIKL